MPFASIIRNDVLCLGTSDESLLDSYFPSLRVTRDVYELSYGSSNDNTMHSFAFRRLHRFHTSTQTYGTIKLTFPRSSLPPQAAPEFLAKRMSSLSVEPSGPEPGVRRRHQPVIRSYDTTNTFSKMETLPFWFAVSAVTVARTPGSLIKSYTS